MGIGTLLFMLTVWVLVTSTAAWSIYRIVSK